MKTTNLNRAAGPVAALHARRHCSTARTNSRSAVLWSAGPRCMKYSSCFGTASTTSAPALFDRQAYAAVYGHLLRHRNPATVMVNAQLTQNTSVYDLAFKATDLVPTDDETAEILMRLGASTWLRKSSTRFPARSNRSDGERYAALQQWPVRYSSRFVEYGTAGAAGARCVSVSAGRECPLPGDLGGDVVRQLLAASRLIAHGLSGGQGNTSSPSRRSASGARPPTGGECR